MDKEVRGFLILMRILQRMEPHSREQELLERLMSDLADEIAIPRSKPGLSVFCALIYAASYAGSKLYDPKETA